jgi:hypothetical protein
MRDVSERFELDRELQDKVLQEHELDVVVGGTVLSSSFSNVIKSIGDGLSSMARRG